MQKIFISYSSKNADWVKTWLVPKIENHGVAAHVDYRDFEIGVPSVINMERAVEQCAKTILVFTPDWVNSEWTQFEGLMLQTQDPIGLRKRILPLMLADCQLPPRLKMFTYADFKNQNDWETQFQRLITQIKKDFAALAAPPKYPPLDEKNIDLTHLPRTEFELFGRQQELTLLDQLWESAGANVVSFVAFGGVGKTTLLNKWVEKMRWDNYRGAQKVFAWSFYSQGTNEQVTSADLFINTALQWFGDQNPQAGSPWDKGKRLADLIRRQKTLLLLDGMEPLQSGHDFEKGKIKDAALSTLVAELAKSNHGLCVITTRENVAEIYRYPATCKQINLEQISEEAGSALLRVRRVQGSEEELQRLSRAFGNHALAINLLAEYLRQFPGHPAQKGFAVSDLNVPDEKGRHARRLMEAFAQQFGDNVELEFLQVLGLFNRPAPRTALETVIKTPLISGLTDRLAKLSEAEWPRLLHKLRELKLLAREYQHRPDTLDCHPLVREHFGEKLRQQNPAAWQEAHSRLYEYYKNLPAKQLPDTLEEMEPLFAAVAHGCQAGRHQEALDEVYWKRISRTDKFFNRVMLGAFGSDVAVLSNFFDDLWSQPVANLTDPAKKFLVSLAGSGLLALGRLHESIPYTQAALNASAQKADWKAAAQDAGNLSELYITLGEIDQAVVYARKSVDFAEHSGDILAKCFGYGALGDSLHQAGNLQESKDSFQKLESLQKEKKSHFHYLYSFQGFQFCGLLLSQGQYQEVQKRASQTLEWAKKYLGLLDVALDKLSLGRAFLLLALSEVEGQAQYFDQARDHLQQAVAGLREAGDQEFIARGLFARAACYCAQNEFALAWADLDEAREIAERGEMKLFLADYHLEACKLQMASGKRQEAKEHLEKAAQMIEEMGYGRRKPEVEELRQQLQSI